VPQTFADTEFIQIKDPLATGIKKSEICVITGYLGQKKLLGRVAKKIDWADVKRILTIDSSQGMNCSIDTAT